MSRTIMLSIAAAATIAVATIASQSADARSFVGSHGFARGHIVRGRGHLAAIVRPPCRWCGPGHRWAFDHHRHHHWVFRDGRWIDIEVAGVAAETPVAAPAPCTCLTKTYTANGLVVFADICTKESASAPAGSSADATQTPTTAQQ